MAGEATPAQMGAFLTLLHAKGETAEEVTGLARAMVDAAVPCPLRTGRRRRGRPGRHRWRPAGEHQRDDAGRVHHRRVRRAGVQARQPRRLVVGGDGGRARGAGRGHRDRARRAWPAAWPRRAWGSASPSASIRPCASSARSARSSACRRSSTSSGPLTNPARTRHQLVGVSDPAMAPIMAGVFGATGSRRTLIVHADDGLDELSVTSPSTVLEVRGDGAGALRADRVAGRSGGARASPGDAGRPARWRRRVQRRRHPRRARGRAGRPARHRRAQRGGRPHGGRAGWTTCRRACGWRPSRSTAAGPRGARRADRYVAGGRVRSGLTGPAPRQTG